VQNARNKIILTAMAILFFKRINYTVNGDILVFDKNGALADWRLYL
jgi:hypothetical protein